MKKVIVMQGVPGSGKSTHASKVALNAQQAGGRVVTASADDFFINLGGGEYKFDGSKLSEAHGECFRAFIHAVMNNADMVIVDNTNTTPMEISPYMLAAQAFGYEAEVHRIECDPDVAAARNTHGVSASSVKVMHERMANNSLPPWWKTVTTRESVAL